MGTKYRDQRVCTVYVCLYACPLTHLKNYVPKAPNITKFTINVYCDRGLILFLRQCNTVPLCRPSFIFVDDVSST